MEVTSDAASAIGFGAYPRGQLSYGAWSVVQANLFHTKIFFLWARKHVLF